MPPRRLALALAALGAAACGEPAPTSDAAHLPDLVQLDWLRPDGGAATFFVLVGQGGLRYTPDTLDIRAGDTVRWLFVNAGHNVVSGPLARPDGRFCSPSDTLCQNNPPTSSAGVIYEHIFSDPGSYPYFCSVHVGGNMRGDIFVH